MPPIVLICGEIVAKIRSTLTAGQERLLDCVYASDLPLASVCAPDSS
jgi:hypothetical protein